jgi:hypothetical protein
MPQPDTAGELQREFGGAYAREAFAEGDARSDGCFLRREQLEEHLMAEEFKPGQIVPESGIYRMMHDQQHADMPHELTVIKGRRFPTCRHCKGVTFELVHGAKHVHEIPHLEEGELTSAPAGHSGDVLRG